MNDWGEWMTAYLRCLGCLCVVVVTGLVVTALCIGLWIP